MAVARPVETVRGSETVLAVDKADNDTFVVIGCATDINYSGDKELLTANCYSGKELLPSGDDPAYTISINGNVKQYTTDNQATNVGSSDLEAWFNSGALKTFKLARPFIGDAVRTFDGFVTSYGESGSVNGLQTYTATITPLKKPVLTTVTA